ncbi:MAG: sigma-70 family RNA polymerase sigma factor [Bacteroidota bacterium]|nr:sigma-70 family RNA polymerase sigma factor [Bacteroidota bacterium]
MLGIKKLNDNELLSAIKKGDKNALLQLYKDNFVMIKNYVVNNSGKPEDAEDVLQDACIVVWEKVSKGQFELSAKLSTFVFSVCKNLWLKKINKNERITPLYNSNTENMSENQTSFSNENLNIVQEMIQTLGEKCRQILILFYFDGLDMVKIANQLNYNNADTAKAKKHQCFKQLQENFLRKYNKNDFEI